jgi:hypothetical protein
VSAPTFEYELENEAAQEAELESARFFARLGRLARDSGRSPALRRIGLSAARSVLLAGNAAAGPCACGGESECECEAEANPLQRVYPDALMEHLGHVAAETHNEAEAEACIGALIPLAARMAPRVSPVILRAAPALIPAVATIARNLRRRPITRPLVRAVPTIVRRTVASISHQVGQGNAVPPRSAVRTLARETARVLGSPSRTVEAWRRSHTLDSRHHAATTGAPAPTCGGGCALCGGLAGGV